MELDFSLCPTGNNPKVINLGSKVAVFEEIFELLFVYRGAERTIIPWLLLKNVAARLLAGISPD